MHPDQQLHGGLGVPTAAALSVEPLLGRSNRRPLRSRQRLSDQRPLRARALPEPLSSIAKLNAFDELFERFSFAVNRIVQGNELRVDLSDRALVFAQTRAEFLDQ